MSPDLDAFFCKGGMFDVGPNDLDENIGKKCRFKDPKKYGFGIVHGHLQEVIAVQRDYRGNLCYRVISLEYKDSFGRTAQVSDIIFTDK